MLDLGITEQAAFALFLPQAIFCAVGAGRGEAQFCQLCVNGGVFLFAFLQFACQFLAFGGRHAKLSGKLNMNTLGLAVEGHNFIDHLAQLVERRVHHRVGNASVRGLFRGCLPDVPWVNGRYIVLQHLAVIGKQGEGAALFAQGFLLRFKAAGIGGGAVGVGLPD